MKSFKFAVHTSAQIDHAIPNSAGKWVPCNFVNDFKNEFVALGSIGIGGAEAALALIGAPINTERPFFIVLALDDPDGYLSQHPACLTAAVLLRRPCGTVGMWFAIFGGLSDTHDDAILYAIERALEGDLVGSPTIDVFQIGESERITLQ